MGKLGRTTLFAAGRRSLPPPRDPAAAATHLVAGRRRLSLAVLFPTFRRKVFPLRKVPKRLRKLKASHTDPKRPFEHVEPV
uniref:Uncharacterized protein n=1 Tax=Oryza sativa subsp. japonica TaxID=39947 RepID=Q2QSI8_ORYSJ|nr:hypothetical protein LOC_Os12g23960 [Oryza sativa Japonica Group]